MYSFPLTMQNRRKLQTDIQWNFPDYTHFLSLKLDSIVLYRDTRFLVCTLQLSRDCHQISVCNSGNLELQPWKMDGCNGISSDYWGKATISSNLFLCFCQVKSLLLP